MENTEPKRRGRPRKDPPAQDTPPAVSDAPVKRGRGRPPLTPEEKQRREELRAQGLQPVKPRFGQENIEPGDNSRFLSHAMAVMAMPPIDITDVNQVEQRINEYMILCNDFDMKPTVKGFCNALRIGRTTLFEWKRGNRRATHQEVICRAYDLLEELWENYMQNGKINPVSGIFLGKNNFGYADKQEYVLTPNNGRPEAMDVATLEAKYAELPDCDD